jgi:hypothetical protein
MGIRGVSLGGFPGGAKVGRDEVSAGLYCLQIGSDLCARRGDIAIRSIDAAVRSIDAPIDEVRDHDADEGD